MEHEIGSKRSLPRRQFSSQCKRHRQLYKCCFCIKRTAVRPFAGEGSFNHGRCRTQRHCHTARQATEGSRLRRNLAAFLLLNLLVATPKLRPRLFHAIRADVQLRRRMTLAIAPWGRTLDDLRCGNNLHLGSGSGHWRWHRARNNHL